VRGPDRHELQVVSYKRIVRRVSYFSWDEKVVMALANILSIIRLYIRKEF